MNEIELKTRCFNCSLELEEMLLLLNPINEIKHFRITEKINEIVLLKKQIQSITNSTLYPYFFYIDYILAKAIFIVYGNVECVLNPLCDNIKQIIKINKTNLNSLNFSRNIKR